AVREERVRERAERVVAADAVAAREPGAHEVGALLGDGEHAIKEQAVTRCGHGDGSVLARRMLRVDEIREACRWHVLQREAAPLLLLTGGPGRREVPLQGREPTLEEPGWLLAPNTEPLDRFAVERQRRLRGNGDGQPMAPCICRVM